MNRTKKILKTSLFLSATSLSFSMESSENDLKNNISRAMYYIQHSNVKDCIDQLKTIQQTINTYSIETSKKTNISNLLRASIDMFGKSNAAYNINQNLTQALALLNQPSSAGMQFNPPARQQTSSKKQSLVQESEDIPSWILEDSLRMADSKQQASVESVVKPPLRATSSLMGNNSMPPAFKEQQSAFTLNNLSEDEQIEIALAKSLMISPAELASQNEEAGAFSPKAIAPKTEQELKKELEVLEGKYAQKKASYDKRFKETTYLDIDQRENLNLGLGQQLNDLKRDIENKKKEIASVKNQQRLQMMMGGGNHQAQNEEEELNQIEIAKILSVDNQNEFQLVQSQPSQQQNAVSINTLVELQKKINAKSFNQENLRQEALTAHDQLTQTQRNIYERFVDAYQNNTETICFIYPKKMTATPVPTSGRNNNCFYYAAFGDKTIQDLINYGILEAQNGFAQNHRNTSIKNIENINALKEKIVDDLLRRWDENAVILHPHFNFTNGTIQSDSIMTIGNLFSMCLNFDTKQKMYHLTGKRMYKNPKEYARYYRDNEDFSPSEMARVIQALYPKVPPIFVYSNTSGSNYEVKDSAKDSAIIWSKERKKTLFLSGIMVEDTLRA